MSDIGHATQTLTMSMFANKDDLINSQQSEITRLNEVVRELRDALKEIVGVASNINNRKLSTINELRYIAKTALADS